jgi:hypothetical protein
MGARIFELKQFPNLNLHRPSGSLEGAWTSLMAATEDPNLGASTSNRSRDNSAHWTGIEEAIEDMVARLDFHTPYTRDGLPNPCAITRIVLLGDSATDPILHNIIDKVLEKHLAHPPKRESWLRDNPDNYLHVSARGAAAQALDGDSNHYDMSGQNQRPACRIPDSQTISPDRQERSNL